MDELTEKYLARMLEGAENGIKQIDVAMEQLEQQKAAMVDQRDDMVASSAELRDLLGLSEEEGLDEVTEMVEETPDEE